MTAAVANYYSRISPNYRRFELPWTRIEEESKRLKKIVIGVMGALLFFSAVIPLLPVSEIERNTAVEIPPRLAKLVIEKKALPPPPPPVVEKPVEEIKPEKPPVAEPPKPEPKPVVIPPKPVEIEPVEQVVEPPPVIKPQPTREQVVEKAREKAKSVGLLAAADDLASLRQNSAVATTNSRSLSSSAQSNNRTERALITSKSSKKSAGVNTSALSRSTGGGGLAGRSTTTVSAPISTVASTTSNGSSSSNSVDGTGGPGQRSQDQIERVFDKNKAAIYALYRRALRSDPTLQGKLVLELTIAASGSVIACRVLSSELNASEFEQKLVRRVKQFNFGEQDVDEITTTKPIDFFPA